MRVTRARLLEDVAQVRIDPSFAEIVVWARRHEIEVQIVSDSFLPLIRHMLAANGIAGIPVLANGLRFEAPDRLLPSFPYYDPACTCSANAKARHLAPYRDQRLIFAGDGHSDLDAALAADVVFAKATLANELDARGVAFYPFDSLEPVLAFLETVPLALDEVANLTAK
jgi:2-hydroxy-3-keto-5-methylthiopentenyl-1-phosphate phosphatase